MPCAVFNMYILARFACLVLGLAADLITIVICIYQLYICVYIYTHTYTHTGKKLSSVLLGENAHVTFMQIREFGALVYSVQFNE